VTKSCTLIIPCFNEERNIEPLFDAVIDVIGDAPEWRLLFVDDGSTDKTLDLIKGLRKRDARVDYLSFLTNYGHQKAILAGLRHCETELALTMDADLQHPPHYIPDLLDEFERSRAHVVVARRQGRQSGLIKHTVSKVFYRLFAALTGVAIIPDASDFRLYDRTAIDVLASVDEREPFLRGLIPSLGLSMSVVPYRIAPRLHEHPSYTFRRSATMGARAFLRFSDAPAKIGFVLGIIGVVASCAQGAHYLYLRLFTDSLIPGQADLMVFLSLVASLMILLMSLILRLLGEINESLRGQPVYIVAESSAGDGPETGRPEHP
jgi:glycosyltransferase involved in cell wall biosynthesis